MKLGLLELAVSEYGAVEGRQRLNGLSAHSKKTFKVRQDLDKGLRASGKTDAPVDPCNTPLHRVGFPRTK